MCPGKLVYKAECGLCLRPENSCPSTVTSKPTTAGTKPTQGKPKTTKAPRTTVKRRTTVAGPKCKYKRPLFYPSNFQ